MNLEGKLTFVASKDLTTLQWFDILESSKQSRKKKLVPYMREKYSRIVAYEQFQDFQ